MTLAIMQPYLFPYIGYWQLIANSDEFVFFDIVQYHKRSWMNRNRILHPNKTKEFQYFLIPITKHKKGTLIKDVVLSNNEKWKENILGKLTVYKELKAPYYDDTIELIKSIFTKEYETFLSLSIESIKMICSYLDIELKYKIASDLNFDRSKIESPDDWALAISKDQKATSYLNPYGGYKIFDEDKYKSNGISLRFIKPNLTPYKQSWRENFTPGLSIIDIMMFNSKDKIKELLSNDFKLLNKKELFGHEKFTT